jgi:hypothetical protein
MTSTISRSMALRNARLERATGVAGRASFVSVVKTESPPADDNNELTAAPVSPRRVIGKHAPQRVDAVKHEYAAEPPPLAIVEQVEDLQRALVPVDAASLVSGGADGENGEAAEERMAAELRARFAKRAHDQRYEPIVAVPPPVHDEGGAAQQSRRKKPMRKRVRRRIEEQEEYFDSGDDDGDGSSHSGGGGHGRASQASEDNNNNAEDDDDDESPARPAAAAAAQAPPMPRAGGAASGLMAMLARSGALGDVEALRGHVAHPLWAQMFRVYGEPARPDKCFGCKFADLRAQALPYEAYRHLIDELSLVVMESGIEAAIVWAHNQWSDNVISMMTFANVAERELYAWTGISIVWHCMDHGHIEQFRQLRAVIEAQYVRDRVSMSHTFSALPFQNAVTDSDVQKDDLDRLARAEAHLQRVKNADPRKSCMFHPALTVSADKAKPYIRWMRYSGRGVMHLQQ